MRACDLQEGARGLGLNLEGSTLPTYLVLSSSGGAEQGTMQGQLLTVARQACRHGWNQMTAVGVTIWCNGRLHRNTFFLIECPQQARDGTKKIWILFFSPYSFFALEIMSFKSLRWCNLEELSYADGAGEHAGIFPAHGGVQCFCSSSESVLIASTSWGY